MAKNKLNRMLTSPDKDIKKAYGANGILSRLFRQILWDLNIGPARFGDLLRQYILDPRNGVPDNKKDQTSARGNLTKEFSRTQMTWKVFMKAMRFLRIRKIVFVIELHHSGPGNKTSLHSTEVNLGDAQMIDLQNQDEVIDPEQEAVGLKELQEIGLGHQLLDQTLEEEISKKETS